MHRLWPALFLLCVACHSSPGQDPDPDGGLPDGGHVLPGPGIAAAWQVKDAKELITGPSTGGRVNDWMLANSKVKFVIEDVRPSDGFDPYGCSIAAADRQRDAGVPGESRWGEVWMGLNFRTAGCDTISIVNDGSDGTPAVIRAVGHDVESPFMASLFNKSPAPLHATIYREYSLAPDVEAMEMNLTIQNDGDTQLDITAPYVGMAMNRGLRHWVSKNGFDFATLTYGQLNTSAEFYAAVGEKISYSVLETRAPFSPIYNFAHVLIGQYPQVHIPAGQADTFRFAFAVGAGDTGTLAAAHKEVLGNLADLVPLTGTVIDASGAPVAAARVHVMDTAQTQSIAFARTAADGTWTSPVKTGSYAVRAVADDRPGSAVQTISVPATGLAGVTLALGAQSRVDITTTDVDGHPIPAKLVLEPTSVTRPNLPTVLGEMWDRQPLVVFSADGTASVPVFPGGWHVTFSRGFEYDRPTVDVTAPAGGSATAAATLHHVVDTTGWVSGDFHVHAQYSPDGDDLLPLKVKAFAAEGVEVPVSTEHEFIGDFGPAATALGMGPFMHTIAGTELTTTGTGHFNIFPLLPDPTKLNHGAFNWYNRTIPNVMDEARLRLTADGDPPIIQMNHPRTTGMDYLGAVGFVASLFSVTKATEFTTKWDSMEVWNGGPIQFFEGCPDASDTGCVKPSTPSAYDWFAFLNHGFKITGTGNSDSHNATFSEVGYPRTYVQVGTDDPLQITDKKVTDAIRAGKVTISGGPFLNISAGGVGIGGTVHGSPVHLRVQVQAPAWMGPLKRVDVWIGDDTIAAGGRVATTLDMANGVTLDTTVDVPVTASNRWILATVRGPINTATRLSTALWPVVESGLPPYAITNPIWVTLP